jgi:GT2 family glycosyltransferase
MINKVLVGITSKNRVSILPKSVNSALNQNYLNKEVSVYDDFSSDGTAELKNIIPNVSWILAQEAKGYLFARNYFLNQTDAIYFVGLDDDSWFLNNSDLTKAVEFMDANPQVSALAFQIQSPDNDDNEKVYLNSFPKDTNNFIGCGHMLRISAVRSVGCYIENPGYYGGEEKDLCIRLLDAGFAVMTFPQVVIWHEKTSISRNISKQHRSGVCNDLVFAVRRVPTLLLVPVILYKIGSHLRFSFMYKAFPLTLPCVYGIIDFIKFIIFANISRNSVSMRTYFKFNKLN